jgi:hypothetical protein
VLRPCRGHIREARAPASTNNIGRWVGKNTDQSSQSEVLEKEKEDAKGADFLRGEDEALYFVIYTLAI